MMITITKLHDELGMCGANLVFPKQSVLRIYGLHNLLE